MDILLVGLVAAVAAALVIALVLVFFSLYKDKFSPYDRPYLANTQNCNILSGWRSNLGNWYEGYLLNQIGLPASIDDYKRIFITDRALNLDELQSGPGPVQEWY